MTTPLNKITIIGLGLIGSSIARGAHKHGLARIICGVDSNTLSLEYARSHGFIHEASSDAAAGVKDADIVIIATPTHLLADICAAIAPHISAGTLVMDTGSVKQLPLAMLTEALPAHALVVPAHPIAGSEQSGVSAGRDDLLEKKRIIITPSAPLQPEEFTRVSSFWQALGGKVEAMPADMHDMIYGYVSHLPQLLSFASAPLVAASEKECGASEICARFLRISSSDKGLWQSIFLLNREVLLGAIDRYLDVIIHIRKELASAPAETPSENSDAARLVLFPRIIASCLVTTVMEAEKKAGVPFVRFAGTGFADFTAPATTDPEGDLEHISSHYAALIPMLASYEKALMELRSTL